MEVLKLGPIIRNLYILYSINGSLPIGKSEGKAFDKRTMKTKDRIHLNKILKELNKKSETWLVNFTRIEGSPYDITYNQIGKGSIIKNSLIKKYFKNLTR